jgi:hypothetical protein
MTIFIGIKTIQMIQPRNGLWDESSIGIPLPQRQTKKIPKSNKRNPAKLMKKIALLLVGLFAATSTTKAVLVFSDTFDSYPNGSIVANSGGIWTQNTGIAGSMLVTNAPSNPQLEVAGASSTRTEDIAHQFSSTYATNGATTELYSSFKLIGTNMPNMFGTYMAHFSGTNSFGTLSGFRARIWINTSNVVTHVPTNANQFYVGIVNSGGGNVTNGIGQWSTALNLGETNIIVTRYVLGTGISTLWVNPSSVSDPSVTATDPIPDDNGNPTNGILNISHYSFRQSNSGGHSGIMRIDDFKVGTSFSDVAGANTSPTIDPIENQNTPASMQIGPISVIVGDDGGAAGLTLTKGSSNPTLVPTNNIVFGGSGANRTVTITPATGLQGYSVITIFVSDGVNITSTSFRLTVGAPTISTIPNQITYSNMSAGPISFTVGDAEGDPLTLTKTSSNPALIPAANVVTSGSGPSRTVTLTPLADQTGVSIITISVTDGYNTNSTSFVLSVSARYGLIFSESFDYNNFVQDTALLGADFNGVVFSQWVNATGTNFDLLLVPGIGNSAAQLSYQRSEDLGVWITNNPALPNNPFSATSGAVLYSSFTLVMSNLPSSGGDYFAIFKDGRTTSNFRGKIYASTVNAATGFYRLGLANVANSFSVQFPLDLQTNQSYLVVSRCNTGTGETVLWVNPTSEASPSVAATDVVTPVGISAYGLRQTTGIGISYLDNLAIGTAFGDVATITVVPIPLYIQSSGANVVLTWSDASFNLQSATIVTGPYTTLSGATSPFTTNTISSQLFFRLIHP